MISDKKTSFTVYLKKETAAGIRAIAEKMGLSASALTEMILSSVLTESADEAFSTFIKNYSDMISKG